MSKKWVNLSETACNSDLIQLADDLIPDLVQSLGLFRQRDLPNFICFKNPWMIEIYNT